MSKHITRVVLIFISLMLLFACSNEKQLKLEVKAVLDGKPASQATVAVDGVELGSTGDDGLFSMIIKKKPGTDVQVSAKKEETGYRIEPWTGSFVMKLPPENVVETYALTAEFKAAKYVTFLVTEKGVPLEDAAVKVQGKEVGKTDEKGEYIYEYTSFPKKGVRLEVAKKKYSRWRKKVKANPGDVFEVSLTKQAVVTVKAVTDEYGITKGIPGVVVSMGGKKVGETNAKGVYRKVYRGKAGKKVRIALAAPGYIPQEWKSTVSLEGQKTVRRYFYPAKPKPIRVGIYGYVDNTPDVDLSETLDRIEEAVSNNLFSYLSFRKVPQKTLNDKITKLKLNVEKITAEGWQKTKLMRTVDMIILGSVIKDERGYTIETKVYSSGGSVVLSQINTARGDKDVKRTAKDIVRNIIDRFPFEGTIIALEDDRYKINLGKNDYKVKKGMEFALMSPVKDNSGKIKRFIDIGTLRVKRTKTTYSLAVIDEMKKEEKIDIGYKVVRRIYTEKEKKKASDTFIVTAKGGLAPDVVPLRGVNVYVNEMWAGTTDVKGTLEVPVRTGKKYEVVLYRHGYQQVTDKISIAKDRQSKEFVLEVNNAVFKVDSRPSGADVFVNNGLIGRTPMRDGKTVGFGFHTVRVSTGGDYRDWENVVEFNKKVVDRTGSNAIVLHKDYLKIGKRAEESGDVDAAIQAYAATEKDHPDYSMSHQRLAQLYMDEKSDYESAIREFENVLSLPANQQLIYKQFAVAYTNLGHAYYERGNGLIREDRESAAQYLAKGIQNLLKAKQNTRFFPSTQYDEAVHDTYYYLALSYHKLYLTTKKSALLDKADSAWKEYFDFFPKKLEADNDFVQIRDSANKYWTQIQDLM